MILHSALPRKALTTELKKFAIKVRGLINSLRKTFQNTIWTKGKNLKMIAKQFLILMSCIMITQCNHGKCNIEDRVRLALRTMNHQTVPQVVDCVVGSGPCDSTGSWIRNHARQAVCGRRCGSNCSCTEVQIRLIVRKMKSQFHSDWSRVEQAYRGRC